jgi:predicted nucleic acid-binding Zn ribbon protein
VGGPADVGVPLAHSLDRVVGSLAGGPAAMRGIGARWSELVGPTVAAHAEPCRLRDGVLTVGVRQPGWATQLRYLEPELLERCRVVLGPGLVSRVEIRVLGAPQHR